MKLIQEELAAAGFEVHIDHNGPVLDDDDRPVAIGRTDRGAEVVAYTTCTLSKEGVGADAKATCVAPDQFSRKIGFQIAVGRALKAWAKKRFREGSYLIATNDVIGSHIIELSKRS